MPLVETRFRIQAKHFSLTYPQCNISKEDLLNHLKDLSPSYICVAQELHEDGNPHLHAYILFPRKKYITNPNFFDLQSSHPNIQATRKPKDWIGYIQKDGNFIEWGQLTVGKVEINLQSVDTKDLFNFCINNKVGYGYYQEEKRRRMEPSFDITINSEGVMNLFLSALVRPVDDFSILLLGPAGCGKTTWAINNCIKPALFCSHIDDLRKFRAGHHQSIIFDDVYFNDLSIGKQIALTDFDQPRSIHVRYGTVSLPQKILKIFTCNDMPFTEHPAILRRLKIIKCF